MGPAQPQALNRYSYVLNNPMRWTDPGGHAVVLGFANAVIFQTALINLRTEAANSLQGMPIDYDKVITDIIQIVGTALNKVAVELVGSLTAMFFEIINHDDLTRQFIDILSYMIDAIDHFYNYSAARNDEGMVLIFEFVGQKTHPTTNTRDWYLRSTIIGSDGFYVQLNDIFVYNDFWNSSRIIFKPLHDLVDPKKPLNP